VIFFCLYTLRYKVLFMNIELKLRSVRTLLLLFMICLFLSGLTAIPIDVELQFIKEVIPKQNVFYQWISKVYDAYVETKAKYPFLMYGYDWLAFAHFILAILFIGPYRDPVRNIWVIQFGLIACVLVIPLAFIAGPFRGIPIGWRLIDCSFGVIGFVLLKVCYNRIRELDRSPVANDITHPEFYTTIARL